MRPLGTNGRRKEIKMLYDEQDLWLLRYVGWMKNIPQELQNRFAASELSPQTVGPLMRQGLLRTNRAGTSICLALAGKNLLKGLGYYVSDEIRQPSKDKLLRRHHAAEAAFLFHRAGLDIFAESPAQLENQMTYLTSAAVRRKPDSSSTHLFGGSRFTGIARMGGNAFLAEYLDNGSMCFSTELRLFQNVISPFSCTPAVVYLERTARDAIDALLYCNERKAEQKKRGDMADYAQALARLSYPVYIVPCSDEGAVQLRMLAEKEYRYILTKYLLGDRYVPPPKHSSFDAFLDGRPFVSLADLDLKRLSRAIAEAQRSGYPSMSIAALPSQLAAIDLWRPILDFPLELFEVYLSDLYALFGMPAAPASPTPFCRGGVGFEQAVRVL